jgi:hypothetical protein
VEFKNFCGVTYCFHNSLICLIVFIYFRAKVASNAPITFSWAFQPAPYDDGSMDGQVTPRPGDQGQPKAENAGLDNTAIIYSIKVTNTLMGGATQCLPCPQGKTEQG